MDIKESIKLNGKYYLAVEDRLLECNGCAFENSAVDCRESNEMIRCSTFNRDIIWKEYNPMESSANTSSANTSSANTSSANTSSAQTQDSIVSEIRELLLQRSQTGIAKYGTTLDRKDLKPSEWCQHLLEELLDASGYVLRLKKDLESIEKITTGSKE